MLSLYCDDSLYVKGHSFIFVFRFYLHNVWINLNCTTVYNIANILAIPMKFTFLGSFSWLFSIFVMATGQSLGIEEEGRVWSMAWNKTPMISTLHYFTSQIDFWIWEELSIDRYPAKVAGSQQLPKCVLFIVLASDLATRSHKCRDCHCKKNSSKL